MPGQLWVCPRLVCSSGDGCADVNAPVSKQVSHLPTTGVFGDGAGWKMYRGTDPGDK